MFSFSEFCTYINEKLSAQVVDHSDEGGEMGATINQSDHALIKTKHLAMKDIVPFEPSSEKIKSPSSSQTFNSLVSTIKSGNRHTIPAITVIEHPKLPGKYLIVDGHHRFSAHKKAGSALIKSNIVPNKNVSFEGSNPIFN